MNDLIASKTAEFSKLPGLILGLDGWILRSIPKNLRKQFLDGYEKILKIVFHPDRYQDSTIKKSRERYLQTVGEAVRFMTEDEFAFEITADTVPTHSNPFVRLQQALDIRDNIISKVSDENNEHTEKLRVALLELEAWRDKFNKLTIISETQKFSQHLLRGVVSKMTSGHPVPLALLKHEITGSIINFKDKKPFSEIAIEKLDYYSKADGGYCNEHCAWFTEGKWIEDLKPMLNKVSSEIQFTRRISDDGMWSIYGAFTLPHLCECLRNIRLTGKTVDESLDYILNGALNEKMEEKIEWMDAVCSFLLPFYKKDMLLLLVDKATSKKHLCLVLKSNAEDSPQDAVISGLRKQINRMQTAQIDSNKHYRSQLGGLRLRNAALTKQLTAIRKAKQLFSQTTK